ncbi:MAG TPA: UDP-2,3-diacylglucosamine diphosphatase [Rhodocyclaceae bacterium]|nr:UDP-2,3-diacylglucosamine diphosphatase [Rhodocyclaceae bacterium]
MTSLFVSDLHLSTGRPETTDLFLRFLAGPAGEADALYILGDLFDYWAGDDDIADPFNARICTALTDLAGTGTRMYFLPGNRDFLIGGEFGVASRLTFIDEPTVVDIAGTPTLLLHGDTLCTDDADYQAFRATVRAPAWRREFLALPLTERKAMIEALRSRSETEKRIKAYDLMDTNSEAVAEAFRRHGVSRMIHGHTHRQARHDHIVDNRSCERWVLGDWGTSGNALAVDAAGCRWLQIAA